ncbi:MAG: ribosomal protein S18-alanine N-acetyltransferase [Parvularculaceae bacterium]
MTMWWVREAGPGDAAAMAEIEAQAFGPAGWGREALHGGLDAPHVTALVAFVGPDGPVEGFALWRRIADEAELLTIGVLPARRRRGAGRALLRRILDGARASNLERIFLEVDGANAAALTLYKQEGFEPVGRRKRYYRDGADAVVMRKTL